MTFFWRASHYDFGGARYCFMSKLLHICDELWSNWSKAVPFMVYYSDEYVFKFIKHSPLPC
jgi:hypothetical protein